jgi:hypothetical protein
MHDAGGFSCLVLGFLQLVAIIPLQSQALRVLRLLESCILNCLSFPSVPPVTQGFDVNNN